MTRLLLSLLLLAGAARADEVEVPPARDVAAELDQLRAEAEARAVEQARATAALRAEIDELRQRARSRVRAGWDQALHLSVWAAPPAEAELGAPPLSPDFPTGVERRRPRELTFALVANGSAQVRFLAGLRDSGGNLAVFSVPHAQLALRASLGGWVEAQLMLDGGSDVLPRLGAAGVLRDAYVDLFPWAVVGLRAGQLKLPFGRQQLVSSLRLLFPQRTVATRAFTFDRDVGAMLVGRFWRDRLHVELALSDGTRLQPAGGSTLRSDAADLAYTLRVLAQPLGSQPLEEGDAWRAASRPSLSFGLTAQYALVPTVEPAPLDDVDGDGVRDNVEVVSAAAEATLRWRGFAVEAEYFYRHERRGAGRPDRAQHGMHAQLSAMIWRALGVGARVSYAEVSDLRAAWLTTGDPLLGDTRLPPRTLFEAGAVLLYQPAHGWRQRLRGQLDYTVRRDLLRSTAGDSARLAHVLELQLQAGF